MTTANGNAPQVVNNGGASKPFKIFIGYDPREDEAYEVCRHSILKRTSIPVEITPIVQSDLRQKGLYWRQRDQFESTEFSFSRFLTPYLANYEGWAMFVDCDFLYLADINELKELIDDKYAVMCVHHDYSPKEKTKMDGAVQTVYPRKNWSSMVLYNCGHPKNKALTPEIVNNQTGAFLHRFQWLQDSEIGSVPFVWNFLEGHCKVDVRNHNIQYIRIYDTDPQVLNAFENTGIEFTVGVHNSDLPAFQSQSYVDSWLTNSILPFYQATRITHITVGNEVTESPDNAANLVVPAMRNVVSALKKSNLQDSIKVSTPLSFGILSNSFPPSEGAFKSSLAYVLNPLLEFLDENQSPFMVSLYPYFAINDDSSLKFALFEPSNQVFIDRNTGLRYDNMFDAQLDAVHFAIANQFRRTRNLLDAQLDDVRFSLPYLNVNDMKTIVIETGYPKGGSPGHRFATIDNARIYNTNLIRHVTSGSGTTTLPGGVHVMSGTPAKPNAEVDVYIFSLFDENLKQGSDIEGHWGIFYPDMTPAYDLEFPGTPSGRSWCIASSQASKSTLQNALDWACGPGKADCSAIQPGGQCFEPDNLVSHASFAFNNYYQQHGLTDEACSFGGTGIKVYSDPSYGNCIYH